MPPGRGWRRCLPGYDLILEGRRRHLAHHRDAAEGPADVSLRCRQQHDRGRKLRQACRSPIASISWEAAPKKIALSFDDGPDPQNTPQILDILKAKHAPATFFVIGSAANQSLGLLQARIRRRPRDWQSHLHAPARGRDFARAARAGAEPDRAALRAARWASRRLLFRPPYGIDHQPETAGRSSVVAAAAVHGISAGGRAHRSARLGRAGRCAAGARQRDRAARARSGQARGWQHRVAARWRRRSQQTIEALPGIIDGLRAAGFRVGAGLGPDRADARAGDAAAESPRARLVADGRADLQLCSSGCASASPGFS